MTALSAAAGWSGQPARVQPPVRATPAAMPSPMTAIRRARPVVHRLLKLRTGRQPHEILVISATVLLGIVGVVLPQEISAAVADAFSAFWARAYWAGMVVFGAVTLFGIFRKRIEGLLIERAGLTVLAVLYGTYVYAALATAGLEALAGITLPTSFAIANLARCWQIRNDLILLRDYLRDHPGDKIW